MSIAARVIGDLRIAAVLVLAARDMAAERCRAAVLDRRHHLELAEADMAGIGLAPCWSVAAEDIRDLQRWTGQDVGRYAGGWSFRSSWASCEAATAGRAGSRCQQSCRWRRAYSALSYPTCRDPEAPG